MEIEEIKEEMKLRRKKKMHPIMKKKKVTRYLNKILITILLTLGLLITLKKNENFEKFFYEHVFEDTLPFAKINQVYQKYFGTSIPFSGMITNQTQSVFQEKLKYLSKEKYEDGVKLTVEKEYLVPILDSGMVVFIGEKEKYGNTVIIQQVDGKDVWYSNIANVNVSLYDYVEKGSLLGEAKDTSLILVYKKDGKVLNYEEYLP